MSGQGEPRSFKDLKHLFPDRAEWVRLSGELGNFLLDQSQVSLVACPRNQNSKHIRRLEPDANRRVFGVPVYINATSTRHQKSCVSTHKPAVACSSPQRLRRDLACIDPALHPRPTTQRCPKACLPCPRFTSPESSSLVNCALPKVTCSQRLVSQSFSPNQGQGK